MLKSKNRFLVLLILSVFFTASCSSFGEEEKVKEDDKPVEVLYNEAVQAIESKNYVEATRLFEEVERQHPYSQWATRAELMAAFSSYKDGRYEQAVLAVDRFVELHPGHKDVDYALYLRALCFYEQISDIARDQEITKEALDSFEVLIQRFPDSRYSRDATLKRDLTLDHLAGKEMEIGRYYLNRGHINAAINRFRFVVKDYQTTTHVAEALFRLVEAYLTLGLKEEATRVASVLGYNYPGSRWYEDSYTLLDPELREQIIVDRSWVDKTVDSLFKPD
jgi:outer membrane protein assembly factor BamD